MDQQDLANQATFSDAGAVNWLASLQGFIDVGERVIYASIADEVRNQPILDLGVGAGRTVPLLTALSKQYCAIDYLPVMVAFARRKFPNVDIQVGDARDLSRFSDETFSLVVFSYAGIDAVDHEGRQRVLAEVNRILKPKGLFWFSTLNKEGKGPRERPWLEYPVRLRSSPTLHGWLSATREFFEGLYNYWRFKNSVVDGDGWQIAPFAAHAYGLLTHYTTLAYQREELACAGFQEEFQVLDHNGKPLDKNSDLRTVDFFNIVTRKASSSVRLPPQPITLSAA